MESAKLLLLSLQTDLRNISTEARKKFVPIKDGCEHAIMRLHTLEQLKDLDDAKCSEGIRKSDDVLKPLLLAFDTKNVKLMMMAISMLNKLIIHGAVAPASVSSVVGKLATLTSTSDENLLLKILQSLLGLVTMIDLHGKDLSKVLTITFFMHTSKIPSVQGTSAASLRQLVNIVFDRAAAELNLRLRQSSSGTEITLSSDLLPSPFVAPNKGASPTNLPPSATDSFMLLQDICSLTGGDMAVWLDLEMISKPFGLELIESVLQSHFYLFQQNQEFCMLVRDRICPLIIKSYKLNGDFPSVLRITRIVAVFVKHFNNVLITECEVFLTKLMKMMDSSNPLWLRLVALEVIKSFCENPQTLKSLYQHYDFEHDHKPAKVFYAIIMTLGQFADTMFSWNNDLMVRTPAVKSRYIDHLLSNEPPLVNESYVISCTVDCLVGIITAIASIAESQKDREIAIQMANVSWPTLLASTSMILEKSNDENLIQDVLKGYRSITFSCGILNLSTPRDAFLTVLAKFTLPRVTQPDQDSIMKDKSMQTMKTLFDIALSMSATLDEGWVLIFDTFQQLDRLLHSPRFSSEGQGNELGYLTSCLDQLFLNTKTIEDQALIQAVKALRSISKDALSSKEKGSNPLFGASKMVEIALHNVFRINKIWDIILEQFTVLANHKDSTLRVFGVDSLTALISTALAQKDRIIPLEKEFLETLAQLSRSQFPECREKSLQVLFKILRTSGQSLTKGWPVVLAIVTGVAMSDDKAHVGVAFKSVQMICNDFLPYLDVDSFTLYISAVGCYGVQTADLNISLTAINLLWNLSDFVARENSSEFAHKGSPTSSLLSPRGLPPKGKVDALVDELIRQAIATAVEKQLNGVTSPTLPRPGFNQEQKSYAFDTLWFSVFTQMKQLGTDGRAEVRNGVIQTLCKSLTTHGELLSTQIWNSCLWKIVFPLLEEVRSLTESAGTESVVSGKVKIMVHHTRNTLDKQWNETLVLILSGITRVFKIFFHSLSELPKFEEIWKKLFEEMIKSAVYNSTEVSVNAIQCILELLLSQGVSNEFPQALWDISWTGFEDLSSGIRAKQQANQKMPANTLSTLVNALSSIFTRLRPKFSNSDMRRLVRIVRPLLLFPPEVESDSVVIQDSVISMLKTMPVNNEIFPFAIVELLTCVSYAIGYDWSNHITDEIFVRATTMQRSFLPMAKKMVELVAKLFAAAESQPQLQTMVFDDTVKVLGAAMMTKFTAYQSNLWISAVEAFITVIKSGLKSINEATLSDVQTNVIWTEIADSIQSFLLNDDRKGIPATPPDIVLRDESIDTSLVDLVTNTMLSSAAKVPLMHDRLVEILNDGATSEKVNRENFSEGCYRNLFYLCSPEGRPEDKYSCHMKIARMVFPQLMNRCKELLEKFIQEDKQSGNFPIARSRLKEVSFVLRQLLVLDLHPELSESVGEFPARKKRHLLKLFPLLCDCITTKENEIKELLKEIFHTAAREIGLE
eukprot:TRINITY_DN4944_c0_g1_i2.p1 TRINITY_DN4944_c0_g1~~TRINITY_DN4944_c0_g1_i2.p1  ORF type:complete len:1482 (+),score=384.90 TRINITY_DN4944_c0_g1_i2:202-4647(+)